MRSIWKGHIRFSLVTIPIQVYSAINSKNTISFRQLHKEDHGAIGYSKVCKSCDKKVPYADIVKGYEYEPDQYVILEKSDFANIKLKSNKAIDIEAFVDLDEVHPTLFESVYFVGPNGEVATKTFNLFAQTIKKTKKAGLGRIILRDKEDVVLLTEHKGGLIMYKMRYPYEIRQIENVPDLKEAEVEEAQLKLAETLVGSLSKKFSEINFEDRYREALLEMVESKIDGKQIINITESEDEAPVVDIMSALKKSIDEAKRKGA
ncbi:MAG: Ku protein [Saprospiraceae bacterium]|nr:Ku protein [Bacteroidia bacterium]NNE13770.1 Ku protein [Saprospiraceae bacterium]NNL91221.1 Ku protein [Saprospiraceae bacterium]